MLSLNKSSCFLLTGINKFLFNPFVIRNYALRRGTRDRKLKKKVKKVEVEKTGFIPHNQRNIVKATSRKSLKVDDSNQKTPIDNVYIQKYYRWKIYPFAEAIQCHRETHHPDIYDVPNANVNIRIELNMIAEKKTRFIDNFSRIAPMPHEFAHGEDRSILAFAKAPERQEQASLAGARLVGGAQLIKEVQKGVVLLKDFQYVVAHPDILPELVSLRGLMKRKFPNPTNGSLTTDLQIAVKNFVNGVTYAAVKDEYEKDFGLIETIIGTLNMDEKHLEENFASLVNDVYKMKPKRDGPFIYRCLMSSPPSRERFKIGFEQYVPDSVEEDSDNEEEDELSSMKT